MKKLITILFLLFPLFGFAQKESLQLTYQIITFQNDTLYQNIDIEKKLFCVRFYQYKKAGKGCEYMQILVSNEKAKSCNETINFEDVTGINPYSVKSFWPFVSVVK